MRKAVILSLLMAMVLPVVLAADSPETAPKKDGTSDDRVVARIDGHPIYFSEVERRVDNFEKKFQEVNPQMKLPEDKRVKMRQDMLDRMVKEKILELAAAKGNYTVTDAEIDERITQLQKLFGEGEAARERFLSGITDMDDFRKNIAKQIKIDKYIDDVQNTQTFEVSDQEIRKYYDENADKFKRDESVRISQITWRLPPEEDPEYAGTLKKAMEEAEVAMKSAQSGADFAELVKKYSDDKKTLEKGGDIGVISRKQLVEPLEEAAFSLAVGEVSKPVKTQFGIYLLKVTEKNEARQFTFDEVREDIRNGLIRNKKGASREQIYEDLRNKAKVEVLL
ncbi:MAG TPA: peptidylprolyl isomerase [bacterium]|nr:peptidylprolyl isomerase [bacterium]